MKYLLSGALLLLALGLEHTQGHGMMLSPPSRSSRWRLDSTAIPNYTDNQLFCGGLTVQTANGGRCGLCGDNFSDPQPRDNELGGEFGQGVITRTFLTGNAVSISIRITKNHLGHFEFHLCNLDEFGGESEQCFNEQHLRFADGSDKLWIGPQSGDFDVTIQLPEGLSCQHCVLRWTYIGANNWNYCEDGTGALGCGPQETFKNCADVSIQLNSMKNFPAFEIVPPVAPLKDAEIAVPSAENRAAAKTSLEEVEQPLLLWENEELITPLEVMEAIQSVATQQ